MRELVDEMGSLLSTGTGGTGSTANLPTVNRGRNLPVG